MRNAPTVDQYMSRIPHTIEGSATLEDAHQVMRKYQIRHLPVMASGDLIGLVSLRDLHLIESLKDIEPRAVPVIDAMSADPYVVKPGARLDRVAAHMAAHKLGSAVVAEDGKVVGVFTTTDALIALLHVWKPPV